MFPQLAGLSSRVSFVRSLLPSVRPQICRLRLWGRAGRAASATGGSLRRAGEAGSCCEWRPFGGGSGPAISGRRTLNPQDLSKALPESGLPFQLDQRLVLGARQIDR